MHIKFSLITQPCQSGKTFQTIAVINDEIASDEEEGRSLHIVFTINTLLNEVQFTSRLRDMSLEHKMKVLVVSSKNLIPPGNDDVFLHTTNIAGAVAILAMNQVKVGVVIMCNNRSRIASQMDFLNYLNNDTQVIIRRCMVYYDEIHKYIDSYKRQIEPLRDQIEHICELNVVHKVFGITATPYNVFQKGTIWESLNQTQHVKPKTDTYYGLKNAKHTTMEFDDMPEETYDWSDDDDVDDIGHDNTAVENDQGHIDPAVEYASRILDLRPDLLQNGSRVFIPGLVKKRSHAGIRAMVLRRKPECVVVTINGTEKTLAFLNEDRLLEAQNALSNNRNINLVARLTRLQLTNDDDNLAEVSDIISQLIDENSLDDRPVVFTGMLCVSVGQTLTNEGYGTFTSMIMNPYSTKSHDATYQLMGRVTGQTKGWETFAHTEIFSTAETMNVGIAMEQAAHAMMDQHGSTVTLQQYQAFIKAAGVKPKRKHKPRTRKSQPTTAT